VKQAEFDKDLLDLIGSAYFCFFCVVVDKAANAQKYGAFCSEQYGYAMAGLLARYCGWLNLVVRGVGDVLAEARYKKADRELGQAFRQIHDHGTSIYPGPQPLSPDVFNRALTSAELKLKEKRDNIAGLQLADLLTHVGKADVLDVYGKEKIKVGPYSETIRRAVQPKYNRKLSTGEVRGFGTVFIAPS